MPIAQNGKCFLTWHGSLPRLAYCRQKWWIKRLYFKNNACSILAGTRHFQKKNSLNENSCPLRVTGHARTWPARFRPLVDGLIVAVKLKSLRLCSSFQKSTDKTLSLVTQQESSDTLLKFLFQRILSWTTLVRILACVLHLMSLPFYDKFWIFGARNLFFFFFF